MPTPHQSTKQCLNIKQEFKYKDRQQLLTLYIQSHSTTHCEMAITGWKETVCRVFRYSLSLFQCASILTCITAWSLIRTASKFLEFSRHQALISSTQRDQTHFPGLSGCLKMQKKSRTLRAAREHCCNSETSWSIQARTLCTDTAVKQEQ